MISEVKSKVLGFFDKHQKFTPIVFFIGGFTWDWLTLKRVDYLLDMLILSAYMGLLSICLFFNNTYARPKFLTKYYLKYRSYLPLAIQFLFGGLTSAYVVYFSRSVSLSKTAFFFVILIIILFANEIFKKRISNVLFQFGAYSFISFTFFAYMIPVLIAKMNVYVFTVSSLVSLALCLTLAYFVLTRKQKRKVYANKSKLLITIFSVHILVTIFYHFNLIPPVPLALNEGLVAYDVKKQNDEYIVSYESNIWFEFWKDHKTDITRVNNERIYVFTSIFAPTDLGKKVYHKWNWYNAEKDIWQTTDEIGFTIMGGRNEGYRGYSYKTNLVDGEWEVEVITDDELLIGVVNFTITNQTENRNIKLKVKEF